MRGSSKRRPLRRAILMLLHDTQSSSLQPPIEFRHEIAVAGGDDRRFWLGTCACPFGSNDQRDEAIPLSGHCFYESRALGVILQRLPKLADRAPDTVVGIQENTLSPNPGNDFVPGDNLVLVLNEQDKYLQGDTLQLQDVTAAAQPPGTEVKLITIAEPDRLVFFDWGRTHSTPPWVGESYNTPETIHVNAKKWFHLARHKT